MIPLVALSRPTLVAVDVVAWAAVHSLTGYAVHRMPNRWFATDGRLTCGREWEDHGRWYERLRIRRWKDRVPEAGAVFAGGTSKRAIPAAADGGLARLAVETRRAEWGHWLAAASSPLFALWNPPWIAVVMVVYGLAVNAPFIAIQRYNRLRIGRAMSRRGSGRASGRSRTDRGTTGASIP